MIASSATTKLSSKGQIVIPEIIRQRLNLKSGDLFMVFGKDDTIVLRSAPQPSDSEFEAIAAEARAYAKSAELKKTDIKAAIKSVRRRS